MALITLPPRSLLSDPTYGAQVCCSLDAAEQWAIINYVLSRILVKEGGDDFSDCTTILSALNEQRNLGLTQGLSYILSSVLELASNEGVTLPATLNELRSDSECFRNDLPTAAGPLISQLLWIMIADQLT